MKQHGEIIISGTGEMYDSGSYASLGTIVNTPSILDMIIREIIIQYTDMSPEDLYEWNDKAYRLKSEYELISIYIYGEMSKQEINEYIEAYDENQYGPLDEQIKWQVSVINTVPSISNITIQEGVTRIGDCMFANMSIQQGFLFPSSLRSIGIKAFLSVNFADTDVHLNEGIEELESFAFAGIKLDGDFYIPGSIKILGDELFDKSSLNKIVLQIADKGSLEYEGALWPYGRTEYDMAGYFEYYY